MGIFEKLPGKPDIGKLERSGNVPALLEALNYAAGNDDDTVWRIRAAAAVALGHLSRPEALRPIRAARQRFQTLAGRSEADQAALQQFQKAETALAVAQSRPVVLAVPAVPSRPPFNWVTPLFFNAFFAVVLFLWPTNSYGSGRLVQEVISSLCAALFIPFGFVWLFSLVFYLRKDTPPVWWRPWRRPALYVLAAVLLVGGVVVRGLLTNPANDAYYWGQYYLKNKNYSEAVSYFDRLLQNYPKSSRAGEVRRLLPGLYTDDVKALAGQGHYLWALQQLKNLRQVGPAEVTLADQLSPDVMAGLAQDTGDDGKAYLQAVTDRACLIQSVGKADDPCLKSSSGSCRDVRLSEIQLPATPSAPARALVCHGDRLTLPPDLAATRPAELRAVIALRESNEADGSCSYSYTGALSGGVSGVVTIYRRHYAVNVLDAKTGAVLATRDFTGGTAGCPDTYKFQSGGANLAQGQVYGSSPAESDITAWLASVVK